MWSVEERVWSGVEWMNGGGGGGGLVVLKGGGQGWVWVVVYDYLQQQGFMVLRYCVISFFVFSLLFLKFVLLLLIV